MLGFRAVCPLLYARVSLWFVVVSLHLVVEPPLRTWRLKSQWSSTTITYLATFSELLSSLNWIRMSERGPRKKSQSPRKINCTILKMLNTNKNSRYLRVYLKISSSYFCSIHFSHMTRCEQKLPLINRTIPAVPRRGIGTYHITQARFDQARHQTHH